MDTRRVSKWIKEDRRKIKFISDPEPVGLRKLDMFIEHDILASMQRAAPKARVPLRPEEDFCAVTDLTSNDLGDQTRWLIAVRDNRDREAFAALFRHFAPRLRAMLAKSGMQGAAAEDIVQEAMLRVWQKVDQFDPERATAAAWIYRIARNQQIDTIRRFSRPVPEALKVPDQPADDPSARLALEAETQKLRNALAQITPEQREIIETVYLGDLSHKEALEATGLPLGTIKSRIRLGLEKLRHELKGLRSE